MKHRAAPKKRVVTLRGHFKENKKGKRWTLFSLFKSGDEYQDDMEQIVDALLNITVTDDKGKNVINQPLQKASRETLGSMDRMSKRMDSGGRTNDSSQNFRRCYSCGEYGHIKIQCHKIFGSPSSNDSLHDPRSCYYCGETGHIKI